MKLQKSLFILFALFFFEVQTSHATFSIVAVDTITGEVGSAGASCISNAQIIWDVIEGMGALNTQSFYLEDNQDNAHVLLAAGIAPDSIMLWLEANDAGVPADPTVRQYGAVTLAGGGASAAFTGSACIPWAGHSFGPGYSAQGTILLGPEIVDTIVFTYLNTPGQLAERLMAALEAAKVPGADQRCLSQGKSSISAFIRVERIGDGGVPYLYEVVPNTTGSNDPIDQLRVQYDAWKLRQIPDADSSEVIVSTLQERADGSSTIDITIVPINYEGDTVRYPEGASVSNSGDGVLSAVIDNGNKTYSATLTAPTNQQEDTLFSSASGFDQAVPLNTQPVITFYGCGDANLDFNLLNILDLNYIVNFLFRFGPPAPIPEAADLNGSGGQPNILDLNLLVNYIFRFGPKPTCGW
jgi:uncharacterized Ntn-hydrolase superfamily protein